MERRASTATDSSTLPDEDNSGEEPSGEGASMIDEIDNPAYRNRAHYSKSTYNAGCRGILCTLAASQSAKYKRYKQGLPVMDMLDFWDKDLEDKEVTRWAAAYLRTQNRPFPPFLSWRMNLMGLNICESFVSQGQIAEKLAEMHLYYNDKGNTTRHSYDNISFRLLTFPALDERDDIEKEFND